MLSGSYSRIFQSNIQCVCEVESIISTGCSTAKNHLIANKRNKATVFHLLLKTIEKSIIMDAGFPGTVQNCSHLIYYPKVLLGQTTTFYKLPVLSTKNITIIFYALWKFFNSIFHHDRTTCLKSPREKSEGLKSDEPADQACSIYCSIHLFENAFLFILINY